MKVARATAMWLSKAADANAESVTAWHRAGKRRHWGELTDLHVREFARERAEEWREYARGVK